MWPFGKRQDATSEILSDADLLFVRARLLEQFAGGILKLEVARCMDAFCEKPTKQSARALVDAEPSLLAMFAGSKNSRRWYEANGIPALEPRRNARQLSREPKFNELVESLLDDRAKYDVLVREFIQAGYSRDLINAAVGDFFKDISE